MSFQPLRINSLKDDLRRMQKRRDGWYYPIYSQGGGAKVFWRKSGETLAAARRALVQDYALTTSLPVPDAMKHRILNALARFREKETRNFNRDFRIAFYTDFPERFNGELSSNPTRALFEAIGLAYDYVGSREIAAGKLAEYKVVFCPGGFGYFATRQISEAVRAFVKEGGGFFGFCAGAFWPLKGHLSLCESRFVYFREVGYTDVILSGKDPLAQGIKNTKNVVYSLYQTPFSQKDYNRRIQMYRANGPLLVRKGRDEASAYFDSSEKYAAIVRSTYGRGRVVAVSTHPDCCVMTTIAKTNLENVICNYKLTKNIALYCAGF